MPELLLYYKKVSESKGEMLCEFVWSDEQNKGGMGNGIRLTGCIGTRWTQAISRKAALVEGPRICRSSVIKLYQMQSESPEVFRMEEGGN